MRRFLNLLLVLTLVLSPASALALDMNYDYYYDGDAPLEEIYSHAASTFWRDWLLRDCIDFGVVIEGSLMEYTGGRGAFADFNLGAMIVTDEKHSVVMPVVGGGRIDSSEAIATIGRYVDGIKLINGLKAPGLVPEEDVQYGWYYAMGLAATAGYHMDVETPVYMQMEDGWTQLTEEEIAQVVFMTAWLAHTYFTTAYVQYPVDGDEDGVTRTLIDLRANNFMRQAMMDCETGAAADMGLGRAGAWIVREDGNLFLAISDRETYWTFRFQPNLDIRLLTGYAVAGFLMMGYDPWTYDLTVVDGESTLLSNSDKNAALTAFYQADYAEELDKLLNKNKE